MTADARMTFDSAMLLKVFSLRMTYVYDGTEYSMTADRIKLKQIGMSACPV